MRKLLCLISLVFVPALCSAQLFAMRDSVPDSYNFWLYLPEQTSTQGIGEVRDSLAVPTSTRDTLHHGLPIVVFLHGRSLCGNDIYRVRKYGTLDALTMGRKIDAAIIAPQNRGDGWWKPERVMRIVDWVSERYDVDTTRLYVLGMSLGGYGAIDFAATYPGRTAAAMGFCGGTSCNQLEGLADVPLWIIHGTADKDVPVSASRRVRDAVEDADSCNLMRYDELSGVGHSLLARTFYLNETYDWLFKHSTADSVRTVDRTISITHDRLNKAYAGLKLNSVTLDVRDPRGAAPTTSDEKCADEEWYTVRQGDTLGHIAQRYGMSVKRLCSLNGISSKSILRIGQRLRIR